MSGYDALIKQAKQLRQSVETQPVHLLKFSDEESGQIDEIWEAVGGAGDDSLEGIYAVRAVLRRCDEDQLDIMHDLILAATLRAGQDPYARMDN